MPETSVSGDSGIDCVLFDLDGTFADTAPDLAYALNQLLTAKGRPAMPFEQIRAAVSHGGAALIRLGFGMTPEQAGFDQLRHELLAIYQANIRRHTELFPGMPELLEQLELRGVRWGVVTNKPSWLTNPLMQALQLDGRPACVVSGDTTPSPKPHPAPILHGCKLAATKPSRCLYVGDAERDIEAGRRAGATTLVALFGYLSSQDRPDEWGADGSIEQPLQILDWLPCDA